jgi:hypothetical protein
LVAQSAEFYQGDVRAATAVFARAIAMIAGEASEAASRDVVEWSGQMREAALALLLLVEGRERGLAVASLAEAIRLLTARPVERISPDAAVRPDPDPDAPVAPARPLDEEDQ